MPTAFPVPVARHPSAAQSRGQSGPSRPDVAVIVPAHDEEPTVGPLVRELRHRYGCQVVVVDDASRDSTAGEALAAGAIVLPLAGRAGAWCAVQAGFRYVLAQGLGLAVTIDADGQHLPGTVGPLLAEMAQGRADVVIGSCLSRTDALRRAALALLRRLGAFGMADLTSGLRVYNEQAMRALLTPQAVALNYQAVGVLLLLRQAGRAVAEIEAPMRQRAHGRSHIFHSPAPMLAHVWQSIWLCLGCGAGTGALQKAALSPLVARRQTAQRLAVLAARHPDAAPGDSP